MHKDQKIRLQKILSDAGVASRRKAEELILNGCVKVNGRTAKLGDKANFVIDRITVNGKRVTKNKRYKYIMLNKPRGYISTMSDEMGRKSLKDLIKDIPSRLYPVGRLDRESEGLIIMTDDGEFANSLMHPSRHVPKTYRVTIRPDIKDEQLAKINAGIEIDGDKTAPADVSVLSKEQGRVVLQIVLYEGKNRQIRKMCETLGIEVARLKRVAVGNVKLGLLKPGKWRDLTEDELKVLMLFNKDSKNTK